MNDRMVLVTRILLWTALFATKAATNNVLVKFKKDRIENAYTKLGQIEELNDKVVYTYESTFVGVALKDLSDQEVKNLALDDDVEVVEPDGTITVDGFDNNVDPIMFSKNKISAQGNQTTNLHNWGLDRIDDEKGMDGSYEYVFAGNGVSVYIFDTGVSKDHVDFGGRVQEECWTDFPLEGCGDGHGHGSHVAGIAAGLYSGVAKEANIVNIKVLNNAGSGNFSGLVAGLEYVKTSREEMSDPPPAVINMSLAGAGISTIVSDAIEAIINTGVVVTVAAGNADAADACDRTPAFIPPAVTVASSDRDDDRSSFSNVGTCVDIFAPGSGIVSSSHTDPYSYVSKSGTSMASPMVAGVAALYLEWDPSLSPIQVRNLMVNHALKDIVTDVRGSPNRLLYVAKVGDPPSPTAAPEPTAKPSSAPVPINNLAPSVIPSGVLSSAPLPLASASPSGVQSTLPSILRSVAPSGPPFAGPSGMPSLYSPSPIPTLSPSVVPSTTPSVITSIRPAVMPGFSPTQVSTQAPSPVPSVAPTPRPSNPSDETDCKYTPACATGFLDRRDGYFLFKDIVSGCDERCVTLLFVENLLRRRGWECGRCPVED